MSFRYRTKLMAEALQIVADAGWGGMVYNYPTQSLVGGVLQSNSMRWSISSAHKFTVMEFEHYLILARRDGLIARTGPSESEIYGVSYEIINEEVTLTLKGMRYLETHNQTLVNKWFHQIVENLPTIITSTITALFIGWALYYWGPIAK